MVILVSIDCFAASVTYGLAKIRVSFFDMIIISLVGSIVLMLALWVAEIVSSFVSPYAAQTAGGGLLVAFGLFMIIKRGLKKYIIEEQKGFSALFLDKGSKNSGSSKSLSVKEAFFLGGILSADCLLSGLSAGISFSIFQKSASVALNFFMGIFAIAIGLEIGKRVNSKDVSVDLSVLEGMVLIMLGTLLMCHL